MDVLYGKANTTLADLLQCPPRVRSLFRTRYRYAFRPSKAAPRRVVASSQCHPSLFNRTQLHHLHTTIHATTAGPNSLAPDCSLTCHFATLVSPTLITQAQLASRTAVSTNVQLMRVASLATTKMLRLQDATGAPRAHTHNTLQGNKHSM